MSAKPNRAEILSTSPRALTGTWEGKNSQGKPLKVTFRDTAGGSALMSEIVGEGHEDMISMIYTSTAPIAW